MDDLATSINTAHDLIGMNIRPLNAELDINEVDPTKIYFNEQGIFFKKEKQYSYELINSDELESAFEEDAYRKIGEKSEFIDIHSGDYYRKDYAITPTYSTLQDDERRIRLSNKPY